MYNHGAAACSSRHISYMHIYAYNTLGYHPLIRSRTLAIIDYLMQWPIYLHELCVCMCLCVCVRECESPLLINSSLTWYLAFQVKNLDK